MVKRTREFFKSVVVKGAIIVVVMGFGITLAASLLYEKYTASVPKDKQAFVAADPQYWGQFGDFVGGILNPVIAFGALFMLTISVLIQKTELAETREQLTESKKAQEEQARMQLLSATIAAKSILYNHHLEFETRIAKRIQLIQHAPENAFGDNGLPLPHDQLVDEFEKLRDQVRVSSEERHKLVVEIQKLVDSAGSEPQRHQPG